MEKEELTHKNLLISIGGRHSVEPKNVVVFEGDANYSHVYLKNGLVLTVATTLKNLEKRFGKHNFLRVHKKYLVNLKEVKSCKKNEVMLKNKKSIIVSRRKKSDLQNRLLVKKSV